MCVEPKQKIQI